MLPEMAAGASSPAEGFEPLSKIAIHKATVELQPSAFVQATPSLLGDKGEDTDRVTVKYGRTKRSVDDWIAVFSPADFNSGKCPNPASYPGEPLLCTAPMKYQYANYSARYTNPGDGSIRFQLIDQRADFAFALFTGGLENARLVAVSKPVAFRNPKAPVFPRLAHGKIHDEIAVTWTSGYDIAPTYPFVERGAVGCGTQPSLAAARGTLTFNRGSMCGEPARTVGWRDPGFIHTAFMKGLWPNKEYYYKIGHELQDGSVVWGKPYTFRAPPSTGQNSLQRVIVFGDMGKAERDGSNEFANYQPGSLNTTDALVRDLDNYAHGYISQWDQFTAQVAPITATNCMIASTEDPSHMPSKSRDFSRKICACAVREILTHDLKPYAGNHERDWPNTGGFFDVKDSSGECGVDYGMFRFCITDSEHDWREGTEQYKFIKHCLLTVDRKHQPWLIFAAHRVLGYSSNARYAMKGSSKEPEDSESMQKLRIFRDRDFGFVKLTAFNHSSLLFEYKKSSDGKVYDSFTIDRDYRDVLSCVHDSCFPTTLAT
uniref:Purple acid phosphatase n=1 Tax=Setaria italica TaxID=4555 RepID=K3YLE6_SETIT